MSDNVNEASDDIVYILQHSYEVEDGIDETKIIGVYATKRKAEEAISRLAKQPGFIDRPTDFFIDAYKINKDHWAEGYVGTDPEEE